MGLVLELWGHQRGCSRVRSSFFIVHRCQYLFCQHPEHFCYSMYSFTLTRWCVCVERRPHPDKSASVHSKKSLNCGMLLAKKYTPARIGAIFIVWFPKLTGFWTLPSILPYQYFLQSSLTRTFSNFSSLLKLITLCHLIFLRKWSYFQFSSLKSHLKITCSTFTPNLTNKPIAVSILSFLFPVSHYTEWPCSI